ncbi:hypothetical protein [Streptomyces sp. NPDC020983]|uniref:hypothetical protein n=1 Tax=Streptomyces sp. NPDC020983 TaxID=3365106 RepID=UPI0037B40596
MTASQASHAFSGHPLVHLAEVNQDKVTPGLLGFVIFAAIAAGLWLLMKNMGKQMKKIDFEEQPAPPAADRPATPAPRTPGS